MTTLWILVFASHAVTINVATYDTEADCLFVAQTVRSHINHAEFECVPSNL